jgi:drug/metabolite transporter (DMT)-like permease
MRDESMALHASPALQTQELADTSCSKSAKKFPMNARNWGLLFLLSLLWGSSFFFYKVLVAALPPVTVVLGRVGLAAFALNLLLLARGERLPRDRWKDFLISGVLNNVLSFVLICWGETRITSGMASILNAVTPMFVVVIGHYVTHDEKMSWSKIAGIVLGIAGTIILVGPQAFSGASAVLGELAVIIASIFYAMGGLYSRHFRGLPPLTAATGQLTAATAILIPLSLAVDRPWTVPMPGWEICMSLLVIALVNTATAYLVYFRLLASAPVTHASLVTFLIPPIALLLGALVLHESITFQAVAGMAVIATGLAALDGRLLRRRA